MQRRHFITTTTLATTMTTTIITVPVLSGCGQADVQTFDSLGMAARAIESLGNDHKSNGAWTLAQMLHHAAQSVEYSMRGFPQPKSAFFQATAGNLAFAFFDARGKMSHSLAEPIPGAPAIEAGAAIDAAVARALKSLRDFEAHTGPLAPHFAYGTLDKAQYTRAHLMHLANHWTEVIRS